VLFLPGLEASRLFWTDPNCFLINCENQLWLSNSDADAEKLYLNPNGTSILSDIYTSAERGAIDEAAIPAAGTNIYKTFLNSLSEWKNEDHLIADYTVTPYDWRLSVDDVLTKGIKNGDNIYYGGANGTYILDELLRMASSSKTHKVTVIAHSNGGLVAKQLMLKLRELGREDLVDRLILVAVPQVGTPKAVGGLLHGTDLGLSFVLDEEHARTLGENMPSAYALMPSQKYFETVSQNSITSKLISFTDSPLYAPERSKYGLLVSNMAELRGYLLGSEGRTEPADFDLDSPNVLKSELLDQASSTHALLDEWQPASTTEVVQIAGWGEKTISGVSYYTEQQRDCVPAQGQFGASRQECGPYYDVKKYKPNFTIEGDGTVVVPSALWMATSTSRVERYWVDLQKYNNENIDKDHAKILEVGDLLDFIKNKLTNSTSSLPTYIAGTASTLSDAPDAKFVYTLHSPLSLDLYDDFGNHTGISTTTGYAEENIPGSRYGTFGEVKYIIANADVAQHLELRGYATGTFSLDIEQVQGDAVLASTTFASVPVSPSTIATFSLPAGGDFSSSTPLLVDVDGNGANDIVLVPEIGATVYPDFTPPEAVFSFNAITKDVVIFGTDNNGTTSTQITPTSTTIIDQSGNTLTIPFIKFKEKPTKLKIVFDTLIYNGVATATPQVTIEYEWEIKNNGTLKSFSQDVRIRGVRRVTSDYSSSKNETKIVDRIREDGEKSVTKTTKTGVDIVALSTNTGILGVTY
jgi:pimeloyl-ACP methyl ester carboxylesterase